MTDMMPKDNPELYQDATQWSLANFFDDEKYAGKTELCYEYDYGDSWEHDIVLLGREEPGMRKILQVPDDMPVICLDGQVGRHAVLTFTLS